MKRLITIILSIVLGISISGCTVISENYHHHGRNHGPIVTFDRYRPVRPIFPPHYGPGRPGSWRHDDGPR
jgi:hypothetical protein